MFYDDKMMNRSKLKNAWRAANGQELCPDAEPLPKVCNLLNSWINSEDQHPRKRMSLRTSSILVHGAAKLYQQGLDDLMEDMVKLEQQMINRNRRTSSSEIELAPDLNTEEFEQSQNDSESSSEPSASAARSSVSIAKPDIATSIQKIQDKVYTSPTFSPLKKWKVNPSVIEKSRKRFISVAPDLNTEEFEQSQNDSESSSEHSASAARFSVSKAKPDIATSIQKIQDKVYISPTFCPVKKWNLNTSVIKKSRERFISVAPDLNTEEFELSKNENESSPGHSASAARSSVSKAKPNIATTIQKKQDIVYTSPTFCPVKKWNVNTSVIKKSRERFISVAPDLNTEEFELSKNENESSPGHSASAVRSDSFDMSNIKRKRQKREIKEK